MKNLKRSVFALLMVVAMGQTMTSCSKTSAADDYDLYENAGGGGGSGGGTGTGGDKPDN